MNKIYHILLSSLILCAALGCSKSALEEEKADRTVKIAVVLTQDSYVRWDRIMKLAQKNIADATDIRPIFEFYDEDSNDVMTLAYQLARDESVDCVIGCESEENTDMLVYQMSKLKKPKPLFTFNTSQEILRKYSRKGFMWGLCESDITQSEIILSQIAQDLFHKEVALIANTSSTTGQSFVDWFAFQAVELGLTPKRICTYNDISEIPSLINELQQLYCPIICAPRSHEEAAEMIMLTDHQAYFSHVAFSNKTLEILSKRDGVGDRLAYGLTIVPDPQTGFQDIYTSRYGEDPIFGEPQLYDAIMVTCLAYAVAEEFDISLNNAVSKLLSTESQYYGGWTSTGIESAFNQIVRTHSIPSISGATGDLAFSPVNHTIINKSTYAFQYLSNYKFYQTAYICRDGEGGSSSAYGAWIWNKIWDQDFDPNHEDAELKPIKGNKAVLVAASSGWENYRHQADILAYYQLLKNRGFTDDDIILIAADDLANHNSNPYPGIIINDDNDLTNLYIDVKVDYRLDQIAPKDFNDIMLGKSSEKLPVVLNSDDDDNVLFIWSGHGVPGALLWDEDNRSVTGKFMSGLFNEMSSNGKYRKMFGIIEACYSGSVALECEGIPKLLLMTAANDKETSKAQLYSTLWDTYLTNSFTASLLNLVEKDNFNSMSIKDMYSETFSMTMGSHVTLYNVGNFGNVYFNYVGDYFQNGLIL